MPTILPNQFSTRRPLNESSIIDPARAEPNPGTGLIVLKPADNLKITGRRSGAQWEKGPEQFRGTALYTLTLPEGMTCWAGCSYTAPYVKKNGQESDKRIRCYGHSMPFVPRYQPGEAFERALRADVELLSERHRLERRKGWGPLQRGFLARTHVLGDFYSPGYVALWDELLTEHEGLRVYGYTHWPLESDIGFAVTCLVQNHAYRVAIRRSERRHPNDPLAGAFDVPHGAPALPDSVVCPQQSHQVPCVSCGLCSNNATNISFWEH